MSYSFHRAFLRIKYKIAKRNVNKDIRRAAPVLPNLISLKFSEDLTDEEMNEPKTSRTLGNCQTPMFQNHYISKNNNDKIL